MTQKPIHEPERRRREQGCAARKSSPEPPGGESEQECLKGGGDDAADAQGHARSHLVELPEQPAMADRRKASEVVGPHVHRLEEWRHGIDEAPAVKHPDELRDTTLGIGDMFEHRDRDDQIEAARREGQVVCVRDQFDMPGEGDIGMHDDGAVVGELQSASADHQHPRLRPHAADVGENVGQRRRTEARARIAQPVDDPMRNASPTRRAVIRPAIRCAFVAVGTEIVGDCEHGIGVVDQHRHAVYAWKAGSAGGTDQPVGALGEWRVLAGADQRDAMEQCVTVPFGLLGRRARRRHLRRSETLIAWLHPVRSAVACVR